MIPALAAYLPRLPRHVVDGGLLGAFSPYGLMASNGAADLLSDYITGRPLPGYAPACRLDGYDDPAYRAKLVVGRLRAALSLRDVRRGGRAASS